MKRMITEMTSSYSPYWDLPIFILVCLTIGYFLLRFLKRMNKPFQGVLAVCIVLFLLCGMLFYSLVHVGNYFVGEQARHLGTALSAFFIFWVAVGLSLTGLALSRNV